MPRSSAWLALPLLLASACERRPPEPIVPDATGETPPTATLEPSQDTNEIADTVEPAVVERPILLLTAPDELARLPVGLDFGALVFGRPEATTRELNELSAYRSFVADLELTGGSTNPTFPRWWLNHTKTSFTLVAVVNRIDRRDFGLTACGETRLLYRLGYAEAEGVIQRLPLAFNVVFEQPDDGQGCVTVARSWMVEEGEDAIAKLTGEGGPLHPSKLTLAQLQVVETNVRVWEDADGGAANELRVFAWNGEDQRLHPMDLELQPRWKTMLVRKIVRRLLTPDSLAVIERGSGQLPDLETQEWAEVRPNDWTAFDEYREMWKRFDANDEPTTLAAAGLTATRGGVEHRLRGMSCSGCHGVRSVAGFHLPGEGGSERLRGGASAHLLSELPWRERYVAALANGETPDPTRKLHNDGPAGFGRMCSVEGSPVDVLTCDPEFVCTPVAKAEFGVCLPRDYAGPGPCEGPRQTCHAPSLWFPGGFEKKACTSDQACARVPVASDLSACWSDDDPWACAHRRAEQTRVDACARQSDCRDGYACVELDDGGVCLPNNTLAEFRLSGHRTRLN